VACSGTRRSRPPLGFDPLDRLLGIIKDMEHAVDSKGWPHATYGNNKVGFTTVDVQTHRLGVSELGQAISAGLIQLTGLGIY